MANITLRQLRYAEAVAQYGHFGLAAEACAVSQPALSVQIKELEASLGLPLFERAPRQVRLTAFGEGWIERARDILRSVGDLEDLARAARGSGLKRLRLGVIPTIAPYLLPRLIRQLGRDLPDMDIQVRETLTPRLVEELASGRLDMAILALPIGQPEFEKVALFDEAMMLVRPEPFAKDPVPAPEALGAMRLLLLEDGHCFRHQALSFCNLKPGDQKEGLDGSSISTLVQMVGAGLGVTLIPQMAASVEARSAPVTIDAFEGKQPKRTVGAIWRKANPLAEQFRQIATVVQRLGSGALD